AAVTAALRRARDTAGTGLPQAWRDDLRRTAEFSEERLTGELDRAVAGTDLGPDRTPLWQRGAGALQWVLLLVALAGALWLLGLVALGWLQLDDVVPLPRVQGIPLPTLLLVGGLLAGALLALVARPLVALGARRRGRAARRRLTERVQDVADIEVLGPLEGAREDHRRFCAAVTRAGS
ncbi:MAG: putative transporter, partial [Modestobacter sp.]|nr:putative transporter [Modestobacter sp.]